MTLVLEVSRPQLRLTTAALAFQGPETYLPRVGTRKSLGNLEARFHLVVAFQAVIQRTVSWSVRVGCQTDRKTTHSANDSAPIRSGN